jgi:hypothetical protein
MYLAFQYINRFPAQRFFTFYFSRANNGSFGDQYLSEDHGDDVDLRSDGDMLGSGTRRSWLQHQLRVLFPGVRPV